MVSMTVGNEEGGASLVALAWPAGALRRADPQPPRSEEAMGDVERASRFLDAQEGGEAAGADLREAAGELSVFEPFARLFRRPERAWQSGVVLGLRSAMATPLGQPLKSAPGEVRSALEAWALERLEIFALRVEPDFNFFGDNGAIRAQLAEELAARGQAREIGAELAGWRAPRAKRAGI